MAQFSKIDAKAVESENAFCSMLTPSFDVTAPCDSPQFALKFAPVQEISKLLQDFTFISKNFDIV